MVKIRPLFTNKAYGESADINKRREIPIRRHEKDSSLEKFEKKEEFLNIKGAKRETMKKHILRYERVTRECEMVGGKTNEKMKEIHLQILRIFQ